MNLNLDNLSEEEIERISEMFIKSLVGNESAQLQAQLLKNEFLLQKNRDLSIIDYVATLELIKEEVTVKKSLKLIQNRIFCKVYDLILEEIEPSLDDLTLNTLFLVIDQYKDLKEISNGKIKFEEQRRKEKEIHSRHRQFTKYIKSRK